MHKHRATRLAVAASLFLVAALFTTVVLEAGSAVDKGVGRPPNILFILADDLGYGDLGCYGQQQIRTPNLDRLASEGTRFTNCYAGSTVCAPSRCALLTGLHMGHARVRANALVPLEPEDFTLAELLKGAGYRTGIIGKWGIGEPETTGVPNRQGFAEWFGYLNQKHAHNYYPLYLWRNEERFELPGNQENHKGQYSTDLFTEEALGFLDRPQREPFFLYLAYTLPHANNELGHETGNGMEVPSDEPYSDRDWPQPQKNHAAMITRLDRDIGRVLERLKSLGLEPNTVVFFSSDNGPHAEGGADPKFFKSAGPLRGHKRDLYDGGIRVPTIVRWPGHVPAGAVSDQVWAFWDVLPTCAEIAAVAAPKGIDGVSMLPALVGQAEVARDFLYWEYPERGFQQAVRMGNWKAVRLEYGQPMELYDLKDDVGEEHNVASEHPDVVARIEEYLKTARTDSEHWPLPQATAAEAGSQ